MNFVIELTPASKSFKKHVWAEGGSFFLKKDAEFHAKQIRKMKDLYTKVEVIPMVCTVDLLTSLFPSIQTL